MKNILTYLKEKRFSISFSLFFAAAMTFIGFNPKVNFDIYTYSMFESVIYGCVYFFVAFVVQFLISRELLD